MLKRSVRPGESETLRIIEFSYHDDEAAEKEYGSKKSFYSIYYILDGAGFFNGYRIGEGFGFVIRPMQEVRLLSDKDSPWKYFKIVFDGAVSENICKKYIQDDERGIFTFDFRFGIADFIGTHFKNSDTLSEAHALYLFFYLMSKHELGLMKNENKYIEEARIYIHLNFHKNISVKDVAAAVNLSDRYLYNLFIKHLGHSPKKELSAVRIRRASVLLARSEIPINEIAESVGFCDPLAFSRFFSKNVGMSPTAYRKQKKEHSTFEKI